MSQQPSPKQPASSIPPDDPQRTLTVARPDREGRYPHIGVVGDTYIRSC